MKIKASDVRECKIYLDINLYIIINNEKYSLTFKNILLGFVVIDCIIYEFTNLDEVVSKLDKRYLDWRNCT